MRLTRQARPLLTPPHTTTSSADDAFPTLQLFILAICRLAEPIALTSIFPYSWVMVLDFNMGDKSSASFYAGILISAFALSEAVTGMFWGALSDRVGRKPVLLGGCAGTMISLLIVGFSTNFWVALTGRVIGGILNGNIGVIQTMVGELVTKPEHEPRAYAVMPFVWSIGTIIGPAIGGTLAKPADNYPSLFSPDGLFGTFRYLLPNLVCAILLFFSIIAGWLLLDETHPDLRAKPPLHHPPTPGGGEEEQREEEEEEFGAPLAMVATAGSMAHAGVDLRAKSYGTFNNVDMGEDEDWSVQEDGKLIPPKAQVFTYRVTMLVVALSIFTYHSMTYDHLFPIFLQDSRSGSASSVHNFALSLLDIPGGLGMSTQTVGLIMAVNGIIALIIQAVVFPLLAEWLGIWDVFVLVTVLHPIAYFIVPFLALLPPKALYPGIYICLTIRNIFSILAYPVLLILIKQASPSHSVLGMINGLAASAGAACRTIAPPIAGYLYSVGSKMGFTGIAWWASAAVAIVGALQIVPMRGKKHALVSIAPAPCLNRALRHEVPPQEAPNPVVHVTVHDSTV
ncbi:hypothetical protein AJ80_04370 [Polytolypa hystricis UAMH7299]|uniref:Major facilitator superfamily (MFS) profile domain-containing protein n=1 Tax=Polytolypa hystricis (strain UAMH7299) TaxID=1447883 RepID=A0A2B7YDN7_POLH7|nr:hypothetical protein AJ80_04370 [Polytolypa hystricis UAMH7299]